MYIIHIKKKNLKNDDFFPLCIFMGTTLGSIIILYSADIICNKDKPIQIHSFIRTSHKIYTIVSISTYALIDAI